MVGDRALDLRACIGKAHSQSSRLLSVGSNEPQKVQSLPCLLGPQDSKASHDIGNKNYDAYKKPPDLTSVGSRLENSENSVLYTTPSVTLPRSTTEGGVVPILQKKPLAPGPQLAPDGLET